VSGEETDEPGRGHIPVTHQAHRLRCRDVTGGVIHEPALPGPDPQPSTHQPEHRRVRFRHPQLRGPEHLIDLPGQPKPGQSPRSRVVAFVNKPTRHRARSPRITANTSGSTSPADTDHRATAPTAPARPNRQASCSTTSRHAASLIRPVTAADNNAGAKATSPTAPAGNPNAASAPASTAGSHRRSTPSRSTTTASTGPASPDGDHRLSRCPLLPGRDPGWSAPPHNRPAMYRSSSARSTRHCPRPPIFTATTDRSRTSAYT